MEKNRISTLAVKFWGTIETPPLNNREQFRQGVIETVLKVTKGNAVTIDYIGYKPDMIGVHHLSSVRTVYEDCVFVSINIPNWGLQRADENFSDTIVSDLIRIFADKTHKHLEIDSTIVNNLLGQRSVEMTTNWKYFRKQG